MVDTFKISGPAVVSLSGGRTSGYMLWRILAAHLGELPSDVVVAFANTGKEMPQTLAFVRDMAERWGVDVVWLEYREAERPADRWRTVTFDTASRDGEPFKALLDRKGFLPNPTMRFCTTELKIRTIKLYARWFGWEHWTNIIGLRADEPRRVARARSNPKERWDNAMPLATAGITKRDVAAFWERQNFDLALPTVNGTTPLGNCDLCFLKSAATISAILRDMPDRVAWWAEAEARASRPLGARFRKDRPGYAELAAAVRNQRAFDFGEADALNDCMCGDPA